MSDSPVIAPWHLPSGLRPAEQPDALSVDAKLLAARVALLIVRDVTEQHFRTTMGKKLSQRQRLEYVRDVCDNALARIK